MFFVGQVVMLSCWSLFEVLILMYYTPWEIIYERSRESSTLKGGKDDEGKMRNIKTQEVVEMKLLFFLGSVGKSMIGFINVLFQTFIHFSGSSHWVQSIFSSFPSFPSLAIFPSPSPH
jgi:hypothetical protein